MAHGEALRIQVVKAVVEDGLSRNEAARIFRVGVASAIRWVHQENTSLLDLVSSE
jgi:transposase